MKTTYHLVMGEPKYGIEYFIGFIMGFNITSFTIDYFIFNNYDLEFNLIFTIIISIMYLIYYKSASQPYFMEVEEESREESDKK